MLVRESELAACGVKDICLAAAAATWPELIPEPNVPIPIIVPNIR